MANPAPEPPPATTPTTGAGQEILHACQRSGEAFDKAMQAGGPTIKATLAAFQPSPMQAADKAGPMDKDPQTQEALARFRRVKERAKSAAP